MNINLTLIGQMLAFGAFVWFCHAKVWPPLIEVLDQRKRKIADGLAAAERGVEEQQAAEERAAELVKQAKQQASDILSKAKKQGNDMVADSKQEARVERERIIASGEAEVGQLVHGARDELRSQVSTLAVQGASQLLGREVDAKTHKKLIDKLIADI